MNHQVANRLRSFLQTSGLTVSYGLLMLGRVLAATPTSVSDGGTTENGILGLLVWFLGIIAAICGVAWMIGGIGGMMNPDKKELFKVFSSVRVAGLMVSGGPAVIFALITTVQKSVSFSGATL